MKWISVKNNELTDKENSNIYVFVQFYGKNNTLITSYVGTWEEIKIFRKYDLEYHYTHYIQLPKYITLNV